MSYDLILLGPDAAKRQQALSEAFDQGISAMGLTPGSDASVRIDAADIDDALGSDGVPVAVWCGRKLVHGETEDTIQVARAKRMLDRGDPVFPVLDDLADYPKKVPEVLKPVNGQVWSQLDAVVTNLLAGFGLARQRRRVFISYRRDESIGVAMQLFKELHLRKYDCFLDSASIEAGDRFQAQLHSKLADVDIVVLLHTKTALDSKWVNEELLAAQERGTELLEVLWPGQKPYAETGFGFPVELHDDDLAAANPNDSQARDDDLEKAKRCLSDDRVKRLIPEIERSRIRSIRTRRDRIVRQLLQDAGSEGLSVTQCPASSTGPRRPYLSLSRSGTAAPAILFTGDGTPDCHELHDRKCDLDQAGHDCDGARLVYDRLGLLSEQVQTLEWLNRHLDMKSVAVQDTKTWMKQL